MNRSSRSWFQRAFCAASVCLLLASCSSAKPATRYYMLNARSDVAGACPVRLGSVSLPAYLQRNNIVLLTGEFELVPAVQHRWAEPLTAGVERVLSGCLAANADAEADVRIERFHGEAAGATVLETQVVLREGAISEPARASLKLALEREQPGYDALVGSHADLLVSLCEAICLMPAELEAARRTGEPVRKRITRSKPVD